MSDPSYVHKPAAQVVRTHLTRYPRHYGALGLWVVAMLVVPTVGRVLPMLPIVGEHFQSDQPSVSTIADEVAQRPLPTPGSAAPSSGPSGGSPAVPPPASAAPTTPSTDAPDTTLPPSDGRDPDEDLPGGDLPLPTLPPLPIPAPPEELEDLLAVVTPMTQQGCSAIGLGGVVLSLAGPGVSDEVPVGEVLSYLSPVYSVCASFPVPQSSGTVCAIDEAAQEAGYPRDVAGLMATPNIIGIGVDTIYNIEAALESYTGQRLGLADRIFEQLGCHTPNA